MATSVAVNPIELGAVGGKQILTSNPTIDPSAVGLAAPPIGSLYVGATQTWQRFGAGATDWAVLNSVAPTNFVPSYPRLPFNFQTGQTSGTKTLTNTEIYGNYYGKVGLNLTIGATFDVRWLVTQAGVGMTWSEIAIAKGAPVLNGAATLTVVGFVSTAGVITSLGGKTSSIPLTAALVADDDIWLLWAVSATTTPPIVQASNLGDPLQSGYILQAAGSLRPSAIVGVPTSIALAGASVVEIWAAIDT